MRKCTVYVFKIGGSTIDVLDYYCSRRGVGLPLFLLRYANTVVFTAPASLHVLGQAQDQFAA